MRTPEGGIMRGVKLPHGLKPEGLGDLSGRRLRSRRSLKQASGARREDGSRIMPRLYPVPWLEMRRAQTFRSALFINPGSYLLSRDLSSDYHRRADVSLPGSEWDRVGPSGYDHQASGSLFTCCLPCCHLLLGSVLLRGGFSSYGHADIRMAW